MLISFYELPLLGTVKGGGFDCRDGTVDAYEGHREGLWNRVKKNMEENKKIKKK